MDINIDNYLRINLMDMSLVLISTLLIVLIVKRFFWKHVKTYLDARTAHIAEELNKSNQNLRESEELKLAYEGKMHSAQEEAGEIIGKAKVKARDEASEIVSTAKDQADSLKDHALKDIEFEKVKVKDQIKEEISEVAMLAAQKVVEKELDENVHKKYIDDFIEQAGDDSWQA